MEFSYSQTENFEIEKLSNDTGCLKKTVEINRGIVKFFWKTQRKTWYLHFGVGRHASFPKNLLLRDLPLRNYFSMTDLLLAM